MNRKAYTLVEILVCIAIITILAALFLSAGRSAMNSSKSTVCVSNLHQLGTAIAMYRNDDGEDPPSNDQGAGLMPYLSNSVLQCPYRDIAQPNDPPRLRVNYFVNGFDPTLSKADLACRESRGPSFPIAHDDNHTSPFVARAVGRSYFIFARVDGSVAREDWKAFIQFEFNPAGFPCPEAKESYNFR